MSDSHKTLGIVVTVYNKEKFIADTLDSVIAQKRLADQVIIVNDGSTDSSLEIVRRKLNKIVRSVLVDQKNSGVSRARNIGISKCTTDYVLCLDGDDLLDNKCLLNFDQALVDNDFLLVAGNRINKQNSKYLDTVTDFTFTLSDYLKNLSSNINLCWTSAVLIKKSALTANTFNEHYSHGEDRELFLRVLENGEGYFLAEPVSKYVNDDEGLSHKIITPGQDLYFRSLKKYIHKVDGSLARKLSLHIFVYRLKRAKVALINGKFKTALRWGLNI